MRKLGSRRGISPPLIMGLIGVLVIVVGLGAGVTGLTVVPVTPATTPSLHYTLTGVAASGYNVTIRSWVNAQPPPGMYVTTVTVNWGGTPVAYNVTNVVNPAKVANGAFGFYVYHNVAANPGTIAVFATVRSIDAGKSYSATTGTLPITVPGGTTGCTSLCPAVAPGFTATETGLSVAFKDVSTYYNATSTIQAWTFGDGGTGGGMAITHVYSAPGTYMVMESVVAVNATGSSAASSSIQNITITSSSTGCTGTGPCAAPLLPILTPTSGLLVGAGVGTIAWAAVWIRPEIGVLLLVAATATGFVVGMLNVGAWVL